MWDKRMMSFRSRHYPTRKQFFLVQQEYAIRYYAVLTFLVMIVVMLRVNAGKEPIYFGLIGETIAILLGNLIANVSLRKLVAEIFFVNDGFSVISIHAALTQTPTQSFPLRFANPTRTPNSIQFHYEDQIMTLKREDWGEDFDLIWNWFQQQNTNSMDFTISTT